MKKSSSKLPRRDWLSTMTAAMRHWVHAIPPLSSCSRSTRMFLRGIMCCALIGLMFSNWLSTMTAAMRHWVHAIPPLSSCSRSTRMFLRGIMCCALIGLMFSCKSAMPVVQRSDTTSYVQRSATHDTIYLRDSVYEREVMKGDTVYLTRTQYRDRWRTRLVHDTIRDTQMVEKVIEKPPERYVPKFYKWCTGLFWALVLGAIIVLCLRFVPL